MAAVHGARLRAPVSVFAGLSTHAQLPPFRLTAGWRWPHREHSPMLKIVPDPPHYLHSLEDTLMMAADYALCAEVVAQQAMLMQPKSPMSLLIMTSMHELETLRKLLESALVQIQKPADPQTLH